MSGEVFVSAPAPHVALLEIDNPPRNVLGRAMRAKMREALASFSDDVSVRCIVLAGRGAAFCSGDDIREELAGAEGPERGSNLSDFGGLIATFERHRCPVIGAINGWSVGGGLELALALDIRLAASTARFVAAGVNVGLTASAYRLPRLIGIAPAKAMLLTGLPHDAAWALRTGLVAEVHTPDALLPAALAMASRIASRAPLSVEATKRIAGAAPDLTPKEGAARQAEELAALVSSEDHKEALRSFLEKRDPVFGRR